MNEVLLKLINTRKKKLGLTTYKLAKLMGVSTTNCGKWLRGEVNPRPAKLKKLIYILGLEQIERKLRIKGIID